MVASLKSLKRKIQTRMRIEIKGAIHTAVIEVTTSDGVPNEIDRLISEFILDLMEASPKNWAEGSDSPESAVKTTK